MNIKLLLFVFALFAGGFAQADSIEIRQRRAQLKDKIDKLKPTHISSCKYKYLDSCYSWYKKGVNKDTVDLPVMNGDSINGSAIYEFLAPYPMPLYLLSDMGYTLLVLCQYRIISDKIIKETPFYWEKVVPKTNGYDTNFITFYHKDSAYYDCKSTDPLKAGFHFVRFKDSVEICFKMSDRPLTESVSLECRALKYLLVLPRALPVEAVLESLETKMNEKRLSFSYPFPKVKIYPMTATR